MKNLGNSQLFLKAKKKRLKHLKYNKSANQIAMLFVVHNEEGVIEDIIQTFFQEVSNKLTPKIIVAEDGSTDNTKELLSKITKNIKLNLVSGKAKKGYMKATKDGLMQANSEIIFITDSDGQFVPSDFWKLYKEIDNYDMIIGWKNNRSDPFWRKAIANSYHFLVRKIFKLHIHDPNTAFRIIKKKVLKDIVQQTKYLEYSFWTEFTVRANNKGYRITEIPIHHRKRTKGKSHIYSFKFLPQMLISQLRGLLKLWKELKVTRNYYFVKK